MTDFDSLGFKLLWEREKDIKVGILKNMICKKSKLKNKIVAAVPSTITHYK